MKNPQAKVPNFSAENLIKTPYFYGDNIMHMDIRNVFVALALIVGAIFLWRKFSKILYANLNLLSEILHGEIKFPVLGLPVYSLVSGIYKGRTIICCYYLLFRKYDTFSICIEPRGIPRKREVFSLDKKGPIEYTTTCGSRIYYTDQSGIIFGHAVYGMRNLPGTLFKALNRDDILFYFDHLSKAAEELEKTVQPLNSQT